MSEKDRPHEQEPPAAPEPPPFDPDEDLIGELEKGWKPGQPSKKTQ